MKRFLPLAGGVLATIILACFLFVTFAGADTDSAWLPPSDLTLQKQADLTVIPPSINGNIDCFAEANAVCAVNTFYGTANTSGAVKLSNTADYWPVVSNIDSRQHFIGIPNSNTAMAYTTEPPYGFYLYFNYNFSSSTLLKNTGADNYYQINRAPDGRLSDKDNHRLAADYTSISFSENGQWMVVSQPNVAMLRVNLQTFEVTPFAQGFDYTIGLSPAPQTAITNDGRYAAIASKDFNRFKLYDLSTCSSVPSTITGPVNCQSRDLQSYLQQQISGFTSAGNLRFISNDTLGLYANYTQGSIHKTARYILSTTLGDINQQDYLALGDSYISGEGAYQYLHGTDTSDNQCHVSLVSYPLLLGQELNYNAYHSVACSGAEAQDIIDTSDGYKGQAKPYATRRNLEQTDRIPSILANFQPGYIDQLDFVKQYQPKVITLSVGGNDTGFRDILTSCAMYPSTCYGTYEDRLELVRQINNQVFPKLVQTYQKLKATGPPDMRTYIIGYPQIAKPGGNCAINVHLNNDELIFSQQLIDYLDGVVQQAAAKAGVFYVNTRDALDSHRMCEAGLGSVALNGLTKGNDFPDILGGPIGRESYHPNTFGHQLLENKILAATHNLTDSMPAANLSAGPPAETGQEILNAPRSGRTVNVTEFDPGISADLAYRQVPFDITIDGAEHALAPNSTLQAELHSSATSLGSYTTDSSGDISAQVVVPPSVPAGYHTLHFYSTDIAGQPIDIYKYIYVANTADDLDGNGVADSTEACVGVPASGQDYDQDDIDDACDGNITQPPAPTTPSAVSVSLSSNSANLIVAASDTSSGQNKPDNTQVTGAIISGSTGGPTVLSASITSPLEKNKLAASDDLKIPIRYYLISAGAFLSAVTLSYFFKRRLF